MFQTPILFILFNRLDTTQQVFAKIREVQPAQLFIAADGPRDGNETDAEKCKAVREWVLNHIDWDCKVQTLFQEKNLGCGRNPATAITWFFEQVEEGIILEDDCIPSLSFFTFCQELLEKYRTNSQIFVIGGNNFQEKPIGNASYYFSAYGHIWGWATWRRAWQHFDYELQTYNEAVLQKSLKSYFKKQQQVDYWLRIYHDMKSNPVPHIWDFQWTIAQWCNNAINIIPNVNLVRNIGFGEDATHTKYEQQGVLNLENHELDTIIHPIRIRINRKADLYTFYKNFERKKKNMFWLKVRDKIKYEWKKAKQFVGL